MAFFSLYNTFRPYAPVLCVAVCCMYARIGDTGSWGGCQYGAYRGTRTIQA